MTTEIDRRVAEFLASRGSGDAGADAEDELNGLYWQDVERLLVPLARDAPDRLEFSPEQRLLLDLGLLDWRLLPGGDTLRPELLRELAAPGRPAFHYFSEWIVRRFRQSLLYGEISPPDDQFPSSTRIIRDLRGRLYLRLSPLFSKLPGADPKAVELFLSGRIDATLDAMDLKLAKGPDERLGEQRRQLVEIRQRLLARARERARDPEDVGLFDALRDLDRQVAERRDSVRVDVPVAAFRTLQPEERERFVVEELRFVKNVLWLGIAGSGVPRPCSVLRSLQPRLTKPDLEAVFALVRDADPTLSFDATVLIAPFHGAGFYEWERDTLILPLLPVRPAEQTAVAALAGARILLDTLQHGARLKQAYEKAFGGDFQAGFTRDYLAWVLEVGRGFKSALDPERFAFFRDHLGPQPAMLYAPPAWAKDDDEAVRECRARAARGLGSYEDHYRLAVFTARTQQIVQAVDHLKAALRANPVDGRALLALGFLSARTGGIDQARRYLSECMAMAPNSLWCVLAGDEMHKL